MIFFPIVNESCRVLDEKVVVQSSDLDIASVLGMGFPAYRYEAVTGFCHFMLSCLIIRFSAEPFAACRGGIVFWADAVGAKHIATRLRKWAEMYGDFFKPCSYLEDRAASGLKLVRDR